MNRKEFNETSGRRCPADTLVRPVEVVMSFPEPELVFSFFGGLEFHSLEEVFVVGAVGSFHNAVFPWLAPWDKGMDKSPSAHEFLKSRLTGVFPFGVFHCELPSVVGPDEKKGGMWPSALRTARATVSAVIFGCISEYFMRVAI